MSERDWLCRFVYLQIDDEGVVDLSKKTFFMFDMINLLQIDDLSLFKRFQGNWLVIQQCQVYFAEGACSDDAQ